VKSRIGIAFGIALVATVAVNALCLFRPLWLSFERRVYDLKSQWSVKENKVDNIVIIDIDERSLDKLGRFQNWPRVYFADVVDYLHHAAVVGIDVLFAEPDTLPVLARQYFTKPSFDSLLEHAIKNHGKVVLISSIEEKPIFTEFNKTGVGSIFADYDGIVRKGFYALFGQKTFPAVISEMVRDTIMAEQFLIYFLSKNSFRKISFSDVYLQRVPSEFFRDKITLIGGTAEGLFDFHAVPFDRHASGIFIHANIINNFINDLKVHEIPYVYVILLTLIIALFLSILTIRRSARMYITVNAIVYCIFLILVFYLFSFQYEIGVIRPSYAFILTIMLTLIYRYQFEEREKRKIKAIFSRYYSKELVEKISIHPPKLGGEKVDCTIIFADIRNFTPYAEKTDPEAVGKSLNSFLGEMVHTVFQYQGRIDKFIGDCVMAVFGSPAELQNHAYNACCAALEMVEKANRLGFKIGIGINSGEVISGNFGSPMRMEYTVIGDAVNLASRLEGQSKVFNCSIVASENTYMRIMKGKNTALQFSELGKVKVKGKEEEITVYSITRASI